MTTLVEAIFINSTNLKNVVQSLHKEDGVRRTLLDVKEKEIFLNDIFEQTICSSIQSEIDFCLNFNWFFNFFWWPWGLLFCMKLGLNIYFSFSGKVRKHRDVASFLAQVDFFKTSL